LRREYPAEQIAFAKYKKLSPAIQQRCGGIFCRFITAMKEGKRRSIMDLYLEKRMYRLTATPKNHAGEQEDGCGRAVRNN
jgi:hypothetical protein